MSLAGADGKQAADLLQASVKKGAATLGTITEQALRRYLALPTGARSRKRLFNREERRELAKALAATNATAELLGAARIRRRLGQVDRLDERQAVKFSERATDFTCFADKPIEPLAPIEALRWFRARVPGLAPRLTDPAFADGVSDEAFELAITTEETLLQRIHALIGRALATGEKISATPKIIDRLLDDAGLTPQNPQYAEMVFRTNMMGAYNRGAHAEMREPDVAESFPVWRYVGIRDGRQGKDHEKHFDQYFPGSVSFEEVRGDRPYNCRCTFIPIHKREWQRLQRGGASISRFSERRRFNEETPRQLLEVPDVPQTDSYSCGAAAAMSVGRYFGVGPQSLPEWKALLHTDPDQGTPPEAIVRVLRSLGLRVSTRQQMTLDDLRQCWNAGSPVICPIQDYSPDAGPRDYDDGHYVTVIGAALGYVFVQDSMADVELEDAHSDAAPGRVMIAEKTFLNVWHDQGSDGTRYERFGIIVSRA